MNTTDIVIRNARPSEHEKVGLLMVDVYSQLEGFPKKSEQPRYYDMLLGVGALTESDNVEIIVAIEKEKILGAVVYFSDLENYGSGGTISQIKNASGFRLLAVDLMQRGKGIGKLLCLECINRARLLRQAQIFIHSTESMKVAWGMYERMGFTRYQEIDFLQGTLPVFGFKKNITMD